MTISYESLFAQRAKYRRAFGRMLSNWREANGWRLYSQAELPASCGFVFVLDGLWWRMEAAQAGELKSFTFMALAELNKHASVPIEDWTPTDFWACYCGLLEVPERWRQP